MTSDDDVLRLDLTHLDEITPDPDEALALHHAELEARFFGIIEEEHAERVGPKTVAPVVGDDFASTADPDLASLNAMQRETWAAEDGVGRAEQHRRLDLVIAFEHAHRAVRPPATETHSGWDDVALDGIIDSILAGTIEIPSPTVGMLSDGSAGLFYPSRVNGLAGESGAGKGWIALTAAAEQMTLGRHVFYLDFEDSPALVMLRLLKVLRADPATARRYFHYKHPARHDPEGIAQMVEQVASTPCAFVVIDSTGESIAAAGLNQNHDEEVARWMQELAHPLADQGGATVLLLDHMVKSEDGGLWPIGSQRKRAAITGAQYVAEVADPFSREKNGMVALRVAKDRHGTREARSVATYIQFQHPIESTVTKPDGTVEIVLGEQLTVVFGTGKTSQQVQADKASKDATALAADVAQIDSMTPKPTSYRDVKKQFGWRDTRAQAAMREWKAKQKP